MRRVLRAVAAVAAAWLWVAGGGGVWGLAVARAEQGPQPPAELVRQLASEDEKVVTEAARKLHQGGHDDVLRQWLKHPDAKVRARVAYAVADLRAAEFVDDMVGLLADENPTVRQDAVWLLGELARPGYEEKVVRLVSDPSPNVRKEVAYYLGEVKATKHEKDLEALLRDPEESVRQAADEALLKIEWEREPCNRRDPDHTTSVATVRGLLVRPYTYSHTCSDFSPDEDEVLHTLAEMCHFCLVLIEDGSRKVYRWYGGRGKTIGEAARWGSRYELRHIEATACVGVVSRLPVPFIHRIRSLKVLP